MSRTLSSISSLAVILICTCGPSRAIIQMPQGDYIDPWVDLRDGRLSVDRQYESGASNQGGLFGFGWCSGFETRLARDPATGAIKVKICGRGDGGTFLQDERDSNRFLGANGRGQIVFQAGTYHFIPGSQQDEERQFDDRGRLIAIQRAGNPLVRIDRVGDAISAISVGEFKYRVSTDVNDRITEIRSPEGPDPSYSVFYSYDLDGNVVELKNMWRNTYNFKYDAAHHLTFIGYPDGTHKDLAYEKLGRVSLFSERAVRGVTCQETYQYGQSAPAYYWVTSEKKCSDGAVVNKAFFDTRMALDEGGRVIGPMRRRQWTATDGLTLSLINPGTGQVISKTTDGKAEEPTPEQQ
jgi:YD repeat-containing protein